MVHQKGPFDAKKEKLSLDSPYLLSMALKGWGIACLILLYEGLRAWEASKKHALFVSFCWFPLAKIVRALISDRLVKENGRWFG